MGKKRRIASAKVSNWNCDLWSLVFDLWPDHWEDSEDGPVLEPLHIVVLLDGTDRLNMDYGSKVPYPTIPWRTGRRDSRTRWSCTGAMQCFRGSRAAGRVAQSQCRSPEGGRSSIDIYRTPLLSTVYLFSLELSGLLHLLEYILPLRAVLSVEELHKVLLKIVGLL